MLEWREAPWRIATLRVSIFLRAIKVSFICVYADSFVALTSMRVAVRFSAVRLGLVLKRLPTYGCMANRVAFQIWEREKLASPRARVASLAKRYRILSECVATSQRASPVPDCADSADHASLVLAYAPRRATPSAL